MNHYGYQLLICGLNEIRIAVDLLVLCEKATEKSDQVVENYNKGKRAFIDGIEKTRGHICEYEGEVIDDCRASNAHGLAMNPDQRCLYNGLADTIELIEREKDKRSGCGLLALEKKCRELVDQMNYYFPVTGLPAPAERKDLDKLPAKVKSYAEQLKATDDYQQHVANGTITEPFIWNGTQTGLAVWLSGGERIPYKDVGDTQQPQWSFANGLFIAKGKDGKWVIMTNKKLGEAYRERGNK